MTHALFDDALDEADLKRLAELIALKAGSGDVIALHGDLGAGKTTFARALTQAISGSPDMDVPSPTFPIVQIYETDRGTVAHYDWYRIVEPEELDELGIDEHLTGAVTLIEWPERAPDTLPPDHLRVALHELTDQPDKRRVTLSATPQSAWARRLERIVHIQRFLEDAIASKTPDFGALARISYLTGDASPRAYARLFDDVGRTIVLMDAPAAIDGLHEYEATSIDPKTTTPLAYSKRAKLAEDIVPFLAVEQALSERNLLTPRVIATDLDKGLACLSDLGDEPFGRAVTVDPACQTELWRAAVDVLIKLRKSGPAPEQPILTHGRSHTIPKLTSEILLHETNLFLDWAAPTTLSSDTQASFHATWAPVFDQALIDAGGWVLRDFHSPNLMWQDPAHEGEHVGIIDFQDALRGPWAYDLVSLLQDARVDVPPNLEAELMNVYCGAIAATEPSFDRVAFEQSYAILGAQRASKVIGIFHRLNRRDGKSSYLAHLPRVEGALRRNLEKPVLEPVRAWFAQALPGLLRSPT
ncbi:MAG: tRNA (adenosine(37)-N6)-threonylcarbamoyltransferase complex ATPase subunit type 1 TsaE [Pseudomonadota bacterium]